MTRFFQGLGAGVLLLVIMGQIQQRPSPATTVQSPQPIPSARFAIYGMDQALPMLLDTQTGRTWFRQVGAKDSLGNSGGLYWTPVKITPADTARQYFFPLGSDVSR